jgi:hypothetical protein
LGENNADCIDCDRPCKILPNDLTGMSRDPDRIPMLALCCAFFGVGVDRAKQNCSRPAQANQQVAQQTAIIGRAGHCFSPFRVIFPTHTLMGSFMKKRIARRRPRLGLRGPSTPLGIPRVTPRNRATAERGTQDSLLTKCPHREYRSEPERRRGSPDRP